MLSYERFTSNASRISYPRCSPNLNTVAIIYTVGQISCSNSFAILHRNNQMPNSAIDLNRSSSKRRTR